jgi:AcrR family transcriptional regulator
MSRGTTLTQKIRDERQTQILTAALRVFATQGLSATKISDIAAEAGVSHGLVPHYFGSKEEIFTAVVERALRGSFDATQRALRQEGTPWERLQSLCGAMLRGILDRPEYVLVIVQVTVNESVPESARRLLDEYGALITRDLASLIQEGQDAGQIVAGDPTLLAETFASLVQGLAIGRLHGRGAAEQRLPDAALVLRLLKA